VLITLEILVDTVDVVLGSVSIDEKFLGFTLFALVPNTTEFLNAISFALNGNIALSYPSLPSLPYDTPSPSPPPHTTMGFKYDHGVQMI